uniref:Cytochrome P450 3036B1 n=1 Tax=Paracyclopina nana TaxID=565004 RepID=A0A0F7DGX8_PARNA|nr:cytochrome P450 3036B1 [Paracyclopina nana]
MWAFVVVFCALVLIYWWKNFARIPGPNFPNGPLGLPLIGYVPVFTEKNILVGLDKAHDQYGEVMSVNLGPSPRMVIIGDYQVLKEVFKEESSTFRPVEMNWGNAYFRSGNGYDSRGLLFSQGQEWTEQRRFALRRLRDFGMGKSSMEELIQEEIRQLCQKLDKQLNQPLKVDLTYNLSVVNALWTVITGSRLSLDDPKLIELVVKIDELMEMSGNVNLVQMFPWTRHIIPELSGWNKSKEIMYGLINFVAKDIKEHQDNFEANKEMLQENPNDFIDAFLAKIQESPESSSFHGQLGINNLKAGLLDLLFAGIETTSTALCWSTLYMIKYPDIQRKVQNEIFKYVGKSRPVNLDDKPNLPFTEAVIQEVLRITCIGPLGIPHCAQTDIKVGNLWIPQGTSIMPNLHRITRNPAAFPEPNNFKPERFLDSQGKYCKIESNIPFSIGKRDCLGKSLALAELFLFFASLMQRYSFKSVHDDLSRVDLEPKVNFTQAPQPFDVIISKLE